MNILYIEQDRKDDIQKHNIIIRIVDEEIE